ncbi:MAG: NUDIX domain-containing protein [Candidatus Levybacteria bacterium]|nr:NUDIX domain-containing protein [Candidatus Levybacteria bacterium]
MNKDRFKLIAAVSIILVRDDKVFLIRRQNTGWGDGQYCLPGGHLEGNETAKEAAIREAKEETGVSIKHRDLIFFNISHVITTSERIHIYFYATRWKGEAINNEKDKGDHADWFSLNKLPKNTLKISRAALNLYKKSIPYSEFGWNR